MTSFKLIVSWTQSRRIDGINMGKYVVDGISRSMRQSDHGNETDSFDCWVNEGLKKFSHTKQMSYSSRS